LQSCYRDMNGCLMFLVSAMATGGYPQLILSIRARISFLCEFRSCEDEIDGELVLNLLLDSSSDNLASADSTSLTKLILSFVKDPAICLSHIRVERNSSLLRAKRRSQGFSMVQRGLDVLDGGPGGAGWLPKVLFLHYVPSALRSRLQNLFFTSSCLAEQPSNFSSPTGLSGHFLNDLNSCSVDNIKEVKGAFDLTYQHLTSALAAASEAGEEFLILALLDCWGVILNEDDHDMLSRVRVFNVLQAVLDSACTHQVVHSESDALDFVTSGNNPSHSVTKAAVKLLYLLSLQVASTGNTRNTNRSSLPHNTFSAPALVRSRSGPGTLSDSVFEILHNQVQLVLQPLIHLQYCTMKSHRSVSRISQDSAIILAETSLFLLSGIYYALHFTMHYTTHCIPRTTHLILYSKYCSC
jgi:hypothetical protein